MQKNTRRRQILYQIFNFDENSLGSDISLEPTSNLGGSTLPRAQGSRMDKDSRFDC